MSSAIEWQISTQPVDYTEAVQRMEQRAADIRKGQASELIWLLEHPALITTGPRTRPTDIQPNIPLPVYETGRGGQATYHGPGQRVIYVQLDLQKRGSDIRQFVTSLESWLIETLASFGIQALQRPGRVGLWIPTLTPEAKIAAIGVRVQKWVSLHGAALNISPNLSHFQYINPCGLQEYSVTSMAALGISASLADVDHMLQKTFYKVFY